MPRTIINRLKSAIPSFLFLFLIHSVFAQSGPSGTQTYAWDLSIQITGASGEENSNAFSEAQILTAGVFVGKALTGEIGNSWKRGSLEYGFELVPLLLQIRPQRIYGGAFEPLILRWNSGLHIGHTTPYLELAGLAYVPFPIYPQEIPRISTSQRGVVAEFRYSQTIGSLSTSAADGGISQMPTWARGIQNSTVSN